MHYALYCLPFPSLPFPIAPFFQCTSCGYALTDVVTCLVEILLSLSFPDAVLGFVLDGMSEIEHALAFGTDDGLQAAALVGVFIKARGMMTPK